ncbi:MAG TPA: mRNA surveillance protein pelota [Candidatus Nanoarchaeia archaeon]|nr:mRNA surveillance protein pelota [Candidatus Nanoarchaeia archaeon]
MKILKQDLKKNIITIKVENLDDLWFLANLIDKNDIISGKTTRKIKIGSEVDRSSSIVKKTVFLKIQTEKIEFSKHSDSLRILGKIIESPDDIPKGSFHSFDLEENSVITIEKEKWLNFQIQRLKQASQIPSSKVLIIAMDRDEVTFALLKNYGFDILTEIKGEVEKKGYVEKKESSFYQDILTILEDYVKRYSINSIIIASPAFWKEDFYKIVKKKSIDISKKITLATCNSTGTNGINEILKREEIKTVLKNDRTNFEINLVDELLKEISKDNLAVYGIKEVKDAANLGAVKTLLITDSLIQEFRQEDKFHELNSIMHQVEKAKGEIHIISSENEAGDKLNGLTGIAAILRYKLY